MQWNIENMFKIVIKHFEMNQIRALNNTQRVDISLNK